MKSPLPYLHLALDAATRVAEYTPTTEYAFLQSPLRQDAVCMRLQEIGENLGQVRRRFPSFYEQHGTEEWQRLIGLRNVISHGYGELDMQVVWRIAFERLPSLAQQIRELLTTG